MIDREINSYKAVESFGEMKILKNNKTYQFDQERAYGLWQGVKEWALVKGETVKGYKELSKWFRLVGNTKQREKTNYHKIE